MMLAFYNENIFRSKKYFVIRTVMCIVCCTAVAKVSIRAINYICKYGVSKYYSWSEFLLLKVLYILSHNHQIKKIFCKINSRNQGPVDIHVSTYASRLIVFIYWPLCNDYHCISSVSEWIKFKIVCKFVDMILHLHVFFNCIFMIIFVNCIFMCLLLIAILK